MRGGCTRCLHRQPFASIQLPSISAPINEGASEESRERAERTEGGATARCRRSHRMGIKRTRAMIREEFQSGVGVGGAVSFALQKIAIKSTGVYLVCFCFNFSFLFYHISPRSYHVRSKVGKENTC